MKAFVLLSKFGDIVQSLAIIEREFKKTGKKLDVVTSDKFASVFEGCGYVGKILLSPSRWGDLGGAIKFAKSRYDDVVVLQCHGENFPFQQTKPSFQHEVYDRVGLLNEWASMRPNFDRRNLAREKALIDGCGLNEGKFILLADQSESSQFKHIEELKVMLNTKFGSDYKIILLSKIRAERIYDLLGIYERAAALVATETVHTHLAWATDVPMFVLSADGWRGSAFRKSFKFHLKYKDWERRKDEFVASIGNFLNGLPQKKVTVFRTDRSHGYNLSSINFGGEQIYTYRYHSGSWKTKLMICDGGKQFPLQVDEKIENNSLEDLRLLIFNDKLHGVYTVAGEFQGQWRCYQAYGEITNDGDQWKIGHIQIKYPGNDFTGTTKNFCPFVHDGKIHVIFGIQGAYQTVFRLDYDRVQLSHQSPAPRWGHGEIRGGVIIPRGDTLLRFFHSRADYPDRTIRYFVGASLMENKPPFKTLKVCTAPILSGGDEYIHGCRHFKNNVVFPLGAIEKNGKILLSYGAQDCECRILELSEGDLNL